MDHSAQDTRGPDAGALFTTDLYMTAGENALLGGFRGGSSEVRAAILARFANRPLPEALLREAASSNDDQVLWSLAQRMDLPAEVVAQLVTSGSALVRTHMAGHPQLTPAQMAPLMPGTASIRSRLFVHPEAPRSLRYGIAVSSSGQYMSASLLDMLDSPEFVLWSLESRDHQVVSNGMNRIPQLPEAWQWDAIVLLAEAGLYPLSELFDLPGWAPSIQRLLAEASSAEQLYGTPPATALLLKRLRDTGRPPATQLQEARLLPDPEDAVLLRDETLDWRGLEAAAGKGELSLAAVRLLLKREDRPISFVSAAAVRFGHNPGLLGSLTLDELHATVAVSALVPEARGRLLRILLKERPQGAGVTDAIGGFPVNDIMAAIDEQDVAITAALRRVVATELADKLGSDPQVWARFEQVRGARPSLPLEQIVARALSG